MEKQWPALDLVKCACVIGMILLHCFYWICTVYGRLIVVPDSVLLPWISRFMIVGFLPLMLPLTAGCALRHQLSPGGESAKLSLSQGLGIAGSSMFLLLLGYLMNVLATGWAAVSSWNVLQFVGCSFVIIAAVLTVAPAPVISVACTGAAVLLIYPWIQAIHPGTTGGLLSLIVLGDPSGFHG
ncbi:MAG TPA: hypothetical protein PKO06_11725, partial [Candidatus Ozemobacteraceae bacterium]|nr:hypothetical protein [Candidatus Ozemobacteraceae bacterium]